MLASNLYYIFQEIFPNRFTRPQLVHQYPLYKKGTTAVLQIGKAKFCREIRIFWGASQHKRRASRQIAALSSVILSLVNLIVCQFKFLWLALTCAQTSKFICSLVHKAPFYLSVGSKTNALKAFMVQCNHDAGKTWSSLVVLTSFLETLTELFMFQSADLKIWPRERDRFSWLQLNKSILL